MSPNSGGSLHAPLRRPLPGGHDPWGARGGGPKGDGGRQGHAEKGKGKGDRLQPFLWQGVEVAPVQKALSFEHPSVAVRSEEECEWIRTRNAIRILKSDSEDTVPRPFCSFEEAPFPDSVHDLLLQSGLQRPTPVQMQAWPSVLQGRDVACVTECDEGRTLAHVLPMLVHVAAQPELKPGEGPIAVVLSPTPERCAIVARDVETFRPTAAITCLASVGGETVTQQERQDAAGMSVVACTPGRLIALLNSRATNFRRATFFVVEDADQLLAKGWGEQVELLLGQARPDRQVLLFASSWSPDVEELAGQVCRHRTIHFFVGPVGMEACRSILQRFVRVWAVHSKADLLVQALEKIRSELAANCKHQALVFCSNAESVRPLADDLRQQGYPCESLHDRQSREEHEDAAGRFLDPESGLWILVCTDSAGRRNLFPNVRYIINYDMPRRFADYVQRLARIPPTPMEPGKSRTGFSLGLLQADELPWNQVKELTAGLKEMGQDIPKWVQEMVRQRRVLPHQQRPAREAPQAQPAQAAQGGAAALGAHGPTAAARAQAQAAPPPATEELRPQGPAQACASWKGRGRGRRRGAFLQELALGRRGLARAASPGLEPPPDFEARGGR